MARLDPKPGLPSKAGRPSPVPRAIAQRRAGSDDEITQPKLFIDAEPISSSQRWHVCVELGAAQIADLARQGVISDRALAWQPGRSSWSELGAIPELIRAPVPSTKTAAALLSRRPPPPSAARRGMALVSSSGRSVEPARPRLPATPVARSVAVAPAPVAFSTVAPVVTIVPPSASVSSDQPRVKRFDSAPALRRGRERSLGWSAMAWAIWGVLAGGAATLGAAWVIGVAEEWPETPQVTPCTDDAWTKAVAVPVAEASTPAMPLRTRPSGEPPTVSAERLPLASEVTPASAPREPTVPRSAGFQRRAAVGALSRAAAASVTCIDADMRVNGKVVVTFAPSGRVTNAHLAHLSDRRATACVLRAFQRARVPAFSGDSVTVTKSFRLSR